METFRANKSFYLSRITRFAKKSYPLLFLRYRDELRFQLNSKLLLYDYFRYDYRKVESRGFIDSVSRARSTNRVPYSRTTFCTLFSPLPPLLSPHVNRATRSKRWWRNSKRNEACGPLVFDSTFREINPRPPRL